MTSDSAFKGLYCTELRSLQDNAQHPVAIQTFFTTLSNVSFFPLARFLPWQTQRTMARPPAPFMVTIFAHDKVHSSRFATFPHLPAPPSPPCFNPLQRMRLRETFPPLLLLRHLWYLMCCSRAGTWRLRSSFAVFRDWVTNRELNTVPLLPD